MGPKVEDYQKLARGETGLVPMRFLRGTTVEKEGEVRGYEPYTAMRLHSEGYAEPLDDLPASGSAPAAPPKQEVDLVEIPDGWEDLHHMKRVSIAKKLGADPADADSADAAIRAELDRRTAAGASA